MPPAWRFSLKRYPRHFSLRRLSKNTTKRFPFQSRYFVDDSKKKIRVIRQSAGGASPAPTASRLYLDPALAWAQSHPNVAQQVLTPPSTDGCSLSLRSITSSLEEYLEWRGWVTVDEEDLVGKDNLPHTIALLSHVLSAPLTLASQLVDNSKNTRDHDNGGSRWCCVGARAEASLPPHFWREGLLLFESAAFGVDDSNRGTNNNNSIVLEFMGPDVPPNIPQTLLKGASSGKRSSSMTLQGGFSGFYHEAPIPDKPWNGFILFNPGLAHSNLQTSWAATVDAILSDGCCNIILTAHSEKDAHRDATLLREKYSLNVNYRENPFASRIRYQDPLDKSGEPHFVQPNQFVAAIDLRG